MSMNFKNLLFLFTILFGLILSNTSNAQDEYLISYEKLTSYEPSTFESLIPIFINLASENFPIPNDSILKLLDAKYSVDLYKILYQCEHPVHGNVQASGAVVIPQVEEGLELPMAIYQHGTTFNQDSVPSYQSLEHYLGAVFSTSGYISLMPDYLGLGDSPHMHPYSHAQSTANAGRDMIRAFRELAPKLNIVSNEEIFVTGYSQGGHGAMALFKSLEEDHCDEFTVTACSALSGAYSISGVMEKVMFAEYSSPRYLPYVIVGYQSVYPELLGNSSFKAPFKEEYGALNNFEGDTDAFFEILDGYNVPRVPIEMLKEELVEEFMNDDNHPFRVAMRDSDNFDWIPQAPLHIQGCCDDEQVSIENAQIAYNTMKDNGKTNLEFTDYCEEYPDEGALRHGGCIPYCLLQTIAFFGEHRNSEPVLCNPISVTENENVVEFNLYPNPVKGNFTNLNLLSPIYDEITLTLYNTYGQLVWVKNENNLAKQTKINTGGLANGFYSLNIKSKSLNFSAPFFIAK